MHPFSSTTVRGYLKCIIFSQLVSQYIYSCSVCLVITIEPEVHGLGFLSTNHHACLFQSLPPRLLVHSHVEE